MRIQKVIRLMVSILVVLSSSLTNVLVVFAGDPLVAGLTDKQGEGALTGATALLPSWFRTVPGPALDVLELALAPKPGETENLEMLTDAAGHYRFAGLPKGSHRVTMDLTTLPAYLRPAEEEPAPVFWLVPGMEETSDLLFGGVRLTAIYDRDSGDIYGVVYLDADGDGVQGPGELGIPGVRVIDPTAHQYYVPFNDANLWTLLQEKGDCHGNTIVGPLISYIFVVSSYDETVFYYDHWEDGYDADPFYPSASTEVGILDAGAVKVFQSDITIANLGNAPYYYDGRDRITVFGEKASVVRLAYPTDPGEVLAGAWDILEVSDWGSDYIATVGEDLLFNAGEEDHDYAGMEVMAGFPGTGIYFNGSLVATLARGQTYFVDGANDGAGGGGIDSDDVITATAPVQVQLLTGGCSSASSARGYSLQPVDLWTNEYWAPVPGFSCKSFDADIQVHNPNDTSLAITVESGLGTGVMTVPAHTTESLLDYAVANFPGWTDVSSAAAGVHLTAAEPFWGVGVIDAIANDQSGSNVHDWGYSLVPISELSSQVVVGYAPGTGAATPADNGNSAFVTAITDTVLYVDLNQDGLPDPFDMNGDGDSNDNDTWGDADWDEPFSALGVTLEAGQSLRVGDPQDRNLGGALIYTEDYLDKIAVAWGQDICQASSGNPYLDLGYTVLPLPVPTLSKYDDLAIDADLTGDVSPGDVLTYTMSLNNNGLGSMNSVILTDSLPYTYSTFVVGSLQISTPPPVNAIEYYDGATWGTVPASDIEQFRILWDTLGPGQQVTITFRVQLKMNIPLSITQITNQAVVNSPKTDPRWSEDPEDPTDPDTDTPIGRAMLDITKETSSNIVRPGDNITYSVTVTNVGTGIALDLVISDVLPLGLQYVPGSLDITWPTAELEALTRTVEHVTFFHGTYIDDFDLSATQHTNYTGNDGRLNWTGDWTEVNDDGNPATGEALVGSTPGNAVSDPGYLELIDNDADVAGVQRGADLSLFSSPLLRFYLQGVNTGSADDNYQVTLNGGSVVNTNYNGSYALREFDLSSAIGAPATLEFLATAGMDGGDIYRFDNIAIYELDPERLVNQVLEWDRQTLAYHSLSGLDPVSYNATTGEMVITNNVRLPSTGVISLTFQAQVLAPLTDTAILTNSACISASNWMVEVDTPCDLAAVQVQTTHALTLTKSAAPAVVWAGDLITYTLAYTTAGDGVSPDTLVVDSVPVSTTFFAASGGVSVDSPAVGSTGVVTWHLGSFPPPASGVLQQTGLVTMVVQVDAGVTTTIANTAWITDADSVSDSDSSTTILADPVIGLAKTAGVPLNNGDGSYTADFTMTLENFGTVLLSNVQITDDLSTTFAGVDSFSIAVAPNSAQVTGNPAYDGSADLNLLSAGNTLDVGEVAEITFSVVFTPGDNLGPYNNSAFAEAAGPRGGPATDRSDDGSDPDPNGNGDPGDPGEDDVTLITLPGLGVVTGVIYQDVDGDGVYTLGVDTVLPGVDVVITDTYGVTRTTTTDANGVYTQTLPAGNATVDVDDADLPPSTMLDTGSSDPTAVVVPNGGSVTDNTGYIRTGQVVGTIYLDVDGDGTYTPGVDTPLPGIDVVITDTLGVTHTATTDANGLYTQTVPAGNATVDVDDADLPPSSVLDSGSSDPTAVVVPVDGLISDDTGYVQIGEVVGVVYLDVDGDGVYTPGVDTPLPGVDVVITDTFGITHTATTDANGLYTQTVPAGNATVDVDDTDLPPSVMLDSGSSDPTAVVVPIGAAVPDNTGYVQTGQVVGAVYLDENGDGIYTPGVDTPLPGVDVVITDTYGMTYTTTTDANGLYTQTVPVGNAIVDVDDADLPPSTMLDSGSSDPTTVVVPGAGLVIDDTGYIRTGQVVGVVYLDVDGDGVYTPGVDTGLPGVDVVITDTLGVTHTATTDANGLYTQTVPAGNATVDVDDADLPPSSVLDSGSSDPTAVVVPVDGLISDDTGYVQVGEVVGVVYLDEDDDGVYTPGVDTPLPGVDVVITDTFGITHTATTDANGLYTQTVPAGNATVDVDDADLPPDLILVDGSTDPTSVTVPAAGSVADDTGYIVIPCNLPPDPYEFDNYYTQALSMTTDGSVVTRTFHVVSDKDWMQFQAHAGRVYTIETSHLAADVDTVLQLYGTDGETLLLENDDFSSGSRASQIVWTAPVSGVYYLRVTHFDHTYDPRMSTVCGNYYLVAVTLAPCPTDLDTHEPDSFFTEATPVLADGRELTRSFGYVADKDWLSFSALKGMVYTISTSYLGGELDTHLQLYDQDGVTLITENNDYMAGSAASQIVWAATEDGTYFVRVTHSDPSYDPLTAAVCGSTYRVSVQTPRCELSDHYEPDNYYSEAPKIVPDGKWLWRHFNNVADKDWLSFYGREGQAYTITTAFLDADVDTVLQIFGVDGVTPLVYNDDYIQGSRASGLIWNAPRDGWYYVRVTHFDQTYDPLLARVCGGGYAVSVDQAALGAEKSAHDINGDVVEARDRIIYTLSVWNKLNVVQTNIVLTDTLPDYLTYISGTLKTDQGEIVSEQPVVVNVDALGIGGRVTVTFEVEVATWSRGKTITNVLLVKSDQQLVELSATVSLNVNARTYLPLIEKRHDFSE